MDLVRTWFTFLVAVAGLLGLARLCRRRRLPGMPLALPVLALLAWAVLRSLPLAALSPGYRRWFQPIDDLLLAYAAIRLVLWLGLQVPGHLGWWRPPPKLLLQLLMVSAGVLATVAVLRQTARFDLVGLVTTSAVLTAVVGLAIQEPLKDLLSGLELQLSDDFQSGDLLELEDGARGVVNTVSWRDTTLRTFDGTLVMVPNTKVTQGVVRNLSAFGAVANRFSIGLDYDYPPGQARKLLEQVVRQHPQVLAEPAPVIRLKAFEASAIAYEVHVWQREASDGALHDLRSDLQEQIWYALKREGQTIPFPVQEIQPRPRSRALPTADQPTPEACCQALARDPLFSALSPEQLRELVDRSLLVSYGPGEAIVQEGADGQSLFHLLRGSVEVLKRMEADRTVAVRRLGPGDVFGEMTLLLDAPRSATVRALEECLLLKVQRDSMRSLLERNPGLLERFATMTSARQANWRAWAATSGSSRPTP